MPKTLPSQFPGRFLQVSGAHDVVPIEHAPRLVPGDLHRDPLGHSRVDEVPHRGPLEVMRVRRATALGNDAVWVQVDGELLGQLPMMFERVPAALTLVVS
jgi:diacylglycerol kinase family enzyme